MNKIFKEHYKLYLAEAAGLAIFMISACFFTAMLEGPTYWHASLADPQLRLLIIALFMGSTAVFIFYFPFTASSGSHINPAVTLTLLRMKKIAPEDAFFYIIFQFIGGTLAVYAMAWLMGPLLTEDPVRFAVTVPGGGVGKAFFAECLIAFIMMNMVLFTSNHPYWKRYTRIFSGCFVTLYVLLAGPVSGFGMNPARTFASALPAHVWTAGWIYFICPVFSMQLALQFYWYIQKKNQARQELRSRKETAEGTAIS
ncbi:MAG TPA: aquaporin [Flavisolibacter sp.]|jgi:aquaporin Z|nr:aquaporin [Flavisolibacter sp.]